MGFVTALAALLATLIFAVRSAAKPNLMLRVLSANPRYSSDLSGLPVYLAGSHTWANLVDVDKHTLPRFRLSGLPPPPRPQRPHVNAAVDLETAAIRGFVGELYYADPLP